MVVGHSWDPYLVRIASSPGRSSEKRRWLCSYLNHVTMSYTDYAWFRSKLCQDEDPAAISGQSQAFTMTMKSTKVQTLGALRMRGIAN